MSKERKEAQAVKATFIMLTVFMLTLSASFLIMPFGNRMALNEGKNGLLYFSGGLFWASFLLEAVLMIINFAACKKVVPDDKKRRPGIFRFFSNTAAKIVDPIAILSIVGFLVCVFVTDKYITYVFLAAMLFFVQMHCIINSKGFEYINSLR